MKRTMNRLVALMLLLALVCAQLPVGVLAAMPVTSGIQTETETYINPLYADVMTEADLAWPAEEPTAELQSFDPALYADTFAAAADQIRDGLTRRDAQVVARYQTENYVKEDHKQIFAAAVAHNGDPKQGDSLRWTHGGYGVKISRTVMSGVTYVTYTYNMTYYTTAEQEMELDQAVADLLQELALNDASDYEKVCSVYDYICRNVTYDYTNLNDSTYKLKYTPYAALINKTSVCQGYALLMYRLLLELGVDTRLISGTGNGGGHGWNIVKLNDLYYNADATWDAVRTEYDYFLRCQENFGDHVRDAEFDTDEFHAAYPMSAADFDPNQEPESIGGTVGEVSWGLDEETGVLTISGTGAMADLDSAEDQPWYEYQDEIETIMVEAGVTSIGDYAFDGLENVETVSLPEGLERVGAAAFEECESLRELVFPDSVTFIGAYAMEECDVLEQVTLPANLTEISAYTFAECEQLTEITIPAMVHTIGEGAFEECEQLTRITIPAAVKTIEKLAFAESGLEVITFEGDAPDMNGSSAYGSFLDVEADAYYPRGNTTWTPDACGNYGGSLRWIAYPELAEVATGWSGATQWTLTDDGKLTVYGSGKMKNYGYGGGQPWLNKGVDITSVVIEEGVTSVGSGAFRNLTTLETVSLPASMTQMGEAAFYGTGLRTVEIPASLWTIQPYTFKNCAALTEVKFNEGNLQKISDGAFYGTALTELVLPDCLDILDVYAFKGCSKLTSITIGSGLTELREAVFYGTAIPTITVPEGITKIGPYAFKNCVALETIDLPTTLKSVGEASFYACTGLKTVELPDAVTSIGNYAFRKCAAIEELTFGAELVTIGECSFYGCTGLTEIVIPDKVTAIKPYAFKTCTGLTSVTLGSSVAAIGEGAFNTCTGLKTIVFPAGLTTIGNYCFSGSENLWKLTFLGDAPAIGTGAFKGMAATAYYPGDNATWTADTMQNYGGRITWKMSA